MISPENVIRFLRSKPALNLSQIEKEAGIPSKTLHKAFSEQKDIPAKHLPALDEALRRYGYTDGLFDKAQIISIVNHKGGVGKTTTVINLGKALSLLGNRVLLIDMDSQGNLSQCFGVHDPQEQVIDSLLDNSPLPLIEITENLYLTPSDIRMAYRESELANSIGADRRLTLKLEEVRDKFDFILIDCPPSLGICTTCSLVASNYCVVPIQPEASAYHGVESLFNRIAEIRTYINPLLVVKGIVFTMVHKNQSVHKSMMAHIRENYRNFHLYETIIEVSTVIKQSQVAKEDLFTYAPKSISWQQYYHLAHEIIAL
ncbi:ParA family protein [Siphonobacter aquaeclarae]|jgi:chromosome partitioning protein|uniref:Chromosome partitioning protein n=1 Tax=Siphonobacter aquaeclarae TaxID=563176 RepID=A0A1G9IZA6_9BACT|nr:ParA family protein [Siphonobacter aquaeclarae]MBO9640111.1 ParA family protein [Siphonobacter aquaeclarae]SDL30425.1 chromosome partitioning protein [Siphonobacter aquaeclarae]